MIILTINKLFKTISNRNCKHHQTDRMAKSTPLTDCCEIWHITIRLWHGLPCQISLIAIYCHLSWGKKKPHWNTALLTKLWNLEAPIPNSLHWPGPNLACNMEPKSHSSVPNFTLLAIHCCPCRSQNGQNTTHFTKFYILNFGTPTPTPIHQSGPNLTLQSGPQYSTTPKFYVDQYTPSPKRCKFT